MKKFGLLALFVGLISMVGCQKEDSSDVNQNKIYTHYEMVYNANSDVTDVIARFRFGNATGTLLQLTDSTNAAVYFNGEKLPYDDLYAGHHKQYAGKIAAGTFKYINTDGDVYINTIPTGDTIGFPASFDTIKKSVAETLTWEGNPLAANESVGVFVGSWTWGQDAAFYTDSDGATNLVMSVTSKASLSLGNAMVYMNRVLQKPADQAPSSGGVVVYQYVSKQQPIIVVN